MDNSGLLQGGWRSPERARAWGRPGLKLAAQGARVVISNRSRAADAGPLGGRGGDGYSAPEAEAVANHDSVEEADTGSRLVEQARNTSAGWISWWPTPGSTAPPASRARARQTRAGDGGELSRVAFYAAWPLRAQTTAGAGVGPPQALMAESRPGGLCIGGQPGGPKTRR